MIEDCQSSGVPLAKRRLLETVTVHRPRCPACGCSQVTKYRSLVDQGDGTGLSWVRCNNAACGRCFRVHWQ
ncbi:MAG: hypothetical protein AABZ47_13865 [Planctomycetota bacterium]